MSIKSVWTQGCFCKKKIPQLSYNKTRPRITTAKTWADASRMMFPILAVHPHGASASQCTRSWELLVANGPIRENHHCRWLISSSIGSTGNPDTSGLLPVDAILNVALPDIAGRSVTGEALKMALAAGGLFLPWMVYVLDKQKQGCPCYLRVCISLHHPSIGAPWQHQQDGHVPPTGYIHDIIAIP